MRSIGIKVILLIAAVTICLVYYWMHNSGSIEEKSQTGSATLSAGLTKQEMPGRQHQELDEAQQSRSLNLQTRSYDSVEDLPSGYLKKETSLLPLNIQQHVLDQLNSHPRPKHDLINSLHVSKNGNLFYTCGIPIDGSSHLSHPAFASSLLTETTHGGEKLNHDTYDYGLGSRPAEAPPIFHSKPGAPIIIYLDFDGHKISGTEWNDSFDVEEFDCIPYHWINDGDPDYMGSNDILEIETIWKGAAAHFASFNVDVTTEAPETLDESVIHVVITGNFDQNGNELPRAKETGGVSFVDVFGAPDYARRSPVFVYHAGLNKSLVADIVAHEAGHYLGLSHDGNSTEEYYPGHETPDGDEWGAVMGRATGRVVQWSKGEYYGANNTEDDLAILRAALQLAPEDEPNLREQALVLPLHREAPVFNGVIHSMDDVDWFEVKVDAGPKLSLKVTAEWNSDYSLHPGCELYDATGEIVTTTITQVLGNSIINLDNPAPGTYFLKVFAEGMGNPMSNPPTGFSAYGSIGNYTIEGTVPNTTSSAPVVLKQPESIRVLSGMGFGIQALRSGNPYVQFDCEFSSDNGDTWEMILDPVYLPGDMIWIRTVQPSMDGWKFRLVFSNELGTVRTNPATLSVYTFGDPLEIYSEPQDVSTVLPDNPSVSFTYDIEQRKESSQYYLWEYLDASSGEWIPTSFNGTQADTLTVNPVHEDMDGRRFRCRVISFSGEYFSREATLSVLRMPSPIVLNEQLFVSLDSEVQLEIGIEGYPVNFTYQWQIFDPASSEWVDMIDESGISGTQSPTVSIESASFDWNGSRFRCFVTNAAGSATSGEILLNVASEYDSAVVRVSANGPSSLFLKSDGSLWGTGDNSNYQLGLNHDLDIATPAMIESAGVIYSSTYDSHSVFLKEDGSLWGMGSNNRGQLAQHDTGITLKTPTRILYDVTDIVSFEALGHADGPGRTVYIRSNRSLWILGHFPESTYGYTNRPANIARNVAAFDSSHYLSMDGDLYNLNGRGELVARGVVDFQGLNGRLYVLEADGDLWEIESGLTPKLIATGIRELSSFNSDILYLDSSNTLWLYTHGENVPNRILETDVSNLYFSEASLFYSKTEGSLWGMGANYHGELGTGFGTPYHDFPVAIMAGVDKPPVTPQHIVSHLMPGNVMLAWGHSKGARTYKLWRGISDDPQQATLVAEGISRTHFADPLDESDPVPNYWIQAANMTGTSGFSAMAIRLDNSTPLTVYDDFSVTYFNRDEWENPLITGKTADPDKDGLMNLQEYAFGSRPDFPDLSHWHIDENTGLLCHHRRRGLEDLGVYYESSPDFLNWSPIESQSLQITPFGATMEKVGIQSINNVQSFVRAYIGPYVYPGDE